MQPLLSLAFLYPLVLTTITRNAGASDSNPFDAIWSTSHPQEPTCEQLRSMWRLSKRQIRQTTPVVPYANPFYRSPSPRGRSKYVNMPNPTPAYRSSVYPYGWTKQRARIPLRGWGTSVASSYDPFGMRSHSLPASSRMPGRSSPIDLDILQKFFTDESYLEDVPAGRLLPGPNHLHGIQSSRTGSSSSSSLYSDIMDEFTEPKDVYGTMTYTPMNATKVRTELRGGLVPSEGSLFPHGPRLKTGKRKGRRRREWFTLSSQRNSFPITGLQIARDKEPPGRNKPIDCMQVMSTASPSPQRAVLTTKPEQVQTKKNSRDQQRRLQALLLVHSMHFLLCLVICGLRQARCKARVNTPCTSLSDCGGCRKLGCINGLCVVPNFRPPGTMRSLFVNDDM
ncbi:unnamed protein product [Cyprideis torosa]|uniref:Uncharacterized protein n=1 Tax=Cyprideis torosa TaxID=163714 RepID=A0A7R8W7X9_9CRUS|nr:unnamed protein product [Cyprideis torosa]CAG0882869.1 unnamed protein product [Cyprideis torosa]